SLPPPNLHQWRPSPNLHTLSTLVRRRLKTTPKFLTTPLRATEPRASPLHRSPTWGRMPLLLSPPTKVQVLPLKLPRLLLRVTQSQKGIRPPPRHQHQWTRA